MSTSNDRVKIRDVNAQFIDGLIYEGIVSMNWLGNAITVDIENKQLIVE